MRNEAVLQEKWTDYPIIAIDTETSGQYPLRDDICEIAAVKSVAGKVVETYQTLVKPRGKMSDFIIGIHGITNDMVKDAPLIVDVLPDFLKFINEGIVVGHHSPFDLGFLSYDIEKYDFAIPKDPALCSSLISRNTITDTPNHKLQTLVKLLGIDGGQAHRALDDAKACLDLTFHCFEKKDVKTFTDAFAIQGSPLWWNYFSVRGRTLQSQMWKTVVEAIEKKKNLEIIYNGGSFKGKKRSVIPHSVVLNPTGDFLVAQDAEVKDAEIKRFYFKRLNEAEIIY
jgi:DNA polymerase-3 subunit epsilon